MTEHSTLPFSQLHVAKFNQGTDASKGSPSGVGDAYYASDTNILYIANAAGSGWVASDLSKINTTGDLVLGQNSILATELAGKPANPASGKRKLYFKSGGLYYLDSAGTEVGPLAAAGGGGGLSSYVEGYDTTGITSLSSTESTMSNLTYNLDPFGFYDTVNTDRIVVPTGKAGDYIITAVFNYIEAANTGSGSGWNQLNGYIYQNTATHLKTGVTFLNAADVNANEIDLAVTVGVTLAVADYITFRVRKLSGSDTIDAVLRDFWAEQVG